MTSPELQRAAAKQGREGGCRDHQRAKEPSRDNSASLVPPQGIYITSVSLSAELKTPQMEELVFDGIVHCSRRRTTRTSPGATKHQL